MTAKVNFFCSAAEERKVLSRLLESEDTHVYDRLEGRLVLRESLSVDKMPLWPKTFEIYIWRSRFGSLIWFTTRPTAAGGTHGSLVANVLAGQAWDDLELGPSGKMLDPDLSPVLVYRRGALHEGRMRPCEILAPPSNLERVGPEYKRWVLRNLAWVRRRGRIVHDWRKPSTTLPNPFGLLDTIYAHPDARKEIESGAQKFSL